MTESQIQYIVNNANSLSCREISRNVNINYSAVRKYCLEHGITFSVRKNNGNSHSFDNITDPGVSYLLGFLWADGYICYTNSKPCGIGVEILLEDSVHVEKLFCRLFKKYGRYTRIRRGRVKPVISLIVNDTNLSDLFVEKYHFDKKSLLFPDVSSFIPFSLRSHFLRGYFDGDGYIDIDKYRISISSTLKNDWSKFINECTKLGITVGKIRRYEHPIKPHKFSEIRMDKKNSMMFLNFIYSSYPIDKLGLNRKYQKYLHITNPMNR